MVRCDGEPTTLLSAMYLFGLVYLVEFVSGSPVFRAPYKFLVGRWVRPNVEHFFSSI